MSATIEHIERRHLAYPSPWWRTFVSQFAGVIVAMLAGTAWSVLSGAEISALAWIAIQAITAAATARLLGMAWWWWLLNSIFAPALALGIALSLPPLWSAGLLLALLAAYGGTVGTRVPLYLSNASAVRALNRLLPQGRTFSLLDLGCGTGTVLAALSRNQGLAQLQGVERAPLPYLIARVRSLVAGHRYRVSWASLWTTDLSDYDVVYAYLSPVPMVQLWEKASREMRPGSMLVSFRFTVPGVAPTQVVKVDGGALYVWRMP